ncbi:uncharacterized protein LOC134648534 [Cydia amplana]|uniref:uncharacterized protein LOC134648534 n=1 Tax=Cydia amplana TaxID=1869771 RepID=UPI002FE5A09C
MKKGKGSQVTLKSKSHSSEIQGKKQEIVLPPLDELKVRIRNLRLTSLDRVPHCVTVTFFDQILISESIMPIGARDPEVEDLFNSLDISGNMSFDPSDYAKMCLFADNPLIVKIQIADQSKRVPCPSCCNIDILPLFQGDTCMRISKRMEPMIEPTVLQLKSWDNLPLISIELEMVRNPENKLHHEILDAANVLKMTVVAAYNLINTHHTSFEYVAASKIRLSNESLRRYVSSPDVNLEREVANSSPVSSTPFQLIDDDPADEWQDATDGEAQVDVGELPQQLVEREVPLAEVGEPTPTVTVEATELSPPAVEVEGLGDRVLRPRKASGIGTFKSTPYPKRFSINSFYPKWESISYEDSFRKCDEKICSSLDDVQNNENINLNYYLNQENQSNAVVWASFHRSLVLAGEVRLLNDHLRQYQWPVEFHMTNEEGGFRFMGFLDLSKLLYPGETTVRLAVPLLWLNSFVMLAKCGCEPFLNSNERTPRSTAGSANQAIKETAATSGSAVTDDTIPQLLPTGADDCPAFMIVEVTLARPLFKAIIPPFIPESKIDKMLGEKADTMPTCIGRGQQNKQWRDTVTSGAEVLRGLPHFGITEFCSFNRQLSKTRTRIELSTSFWQEAAIYVNNNFVVQDFVYSDNTFEEMVMMAHSCLVREASKALVASESEQDHTLRAARHARQLQDIPHAIELYLQLVTENQNNANSWRELATCMMDEDIDLARVCINEALLLNPRHPLTLLSKGSMLHQEDPESAELFFTAILALYPFWTSGWVIAQAFYVERQEFLMADKIQYFVKETRTENLAVDLAPERGWEKELGDWWYSTPLLPATNQFLEAADLLLRLRTMPLAEVCLARALSSQGVTPAYSHLVTLACRLRGDIDNALCLLKEGFDSFGEVNYLHSLQAECLKKKKNHNAAFTSFEKAGNCVNSYSILSALPGREPQRARSVLVDLLRRQPSAYAWMALADDWLMRQVAAGKLGGAGDADAEVAMSACAAACAEQALRWDRRCARAWALLAQLAKPKARRAHCKAMATSFGYKWSDENCELSGAQQSLCHLLGSALQECRCNLCETTDKPDCAHLECECVKSVLL